MEIPGALNLRCNTILPVFKRHFFKYGVLTTCQHCFTCRRLKHTLNTMDPCIAPLIGGMVSAQLSNVFVKALLSATSHAKASTQTPCVVNSWTRDTAAFDWAPERDNKIRFFAPRLAIHRAALRPSPPNPPAIKYEDPPSNW